MTTFPAMPPLRAHVDLDAPRDTVYACVVEREPYEYWTAAFSPGSTFRGTWRTGERLRFVAPPEQPGGPERGMISEVVRAERPAAIELRHVGEFVGEAETAYEQRAHEHYYLEELPGGRTRFRVDMELPDEYHDSMAKLWDAAFALLREVAEGRAGRT